MNFRFTRSRYFEVDYDVYRMSTCIHFSHLSFTTEMDSSLNYAVSTFIKSCGILDYLTLIHQKVSACEIAKIK